MRTRVLILAQGEQKRLPNLPVAKQLLRLPACGDATILSRTLTQLTALARHPSETYDHERRQVGAGVEVRLVTWINTYENLVRDRHLPFCPSLTILDDPGNSSLKGVHRALVKTELALSEVDHTIVLLGDTVYSWACLQALLDPSPPYRFAGTSDLSNEGGELWGVAWRSEYEPGMLEALERALNKHPKFREYQPGQLRRWLWEFADLRRAIRGTTADALQGPWFHAVDDYTRDIDIPEHLDLLVGLSRAAAEDDAKHGAIW